MSDKNKSKNESDEKSLIIPKILHEWNVLCKYSRKKINRYWNAFFIIFSLVVFAIPPIWYSAWFPDAQQDIFNKIKNELKTDVEKDNLKKPGFFYVSWKHVDDFSAPTPWMIIVTVLFGMAQFKQFRLTDDIKDLYDENVELKEKLKEVNKNLDESNNKFINYEIQARKFLSEEQADHADTRRHYAYSVKQELQNFFTQHKWFDSNECRLSLYTFDKSQNTANLIYRYCIISKLEKIGRLSISARDGVIAAALNNGDSVWMKVVKYTKKNNKRYEAEIRKYLSDHYGVTVSDETFQNVRMKPSVYYCRSIRKQSGINFDKFAVFVIESENPEAFTEDLMNEVFSQKNHQIYRMVDHLSKLEAVMNPIQEAV